MNYGLNIDYGLWIGFGFNISELNGYGLDLELELSPSGTSDCGLLIISSSNTSLVKISKVIRLILDTLDQGSATF